MTLKEKFDEIHKSFINGDFVATDLIKEQCEQIADEFAIGFAEWCTETKNKLGYHEYKKEWYVWDLDKWVITKKLLEIYKKEKGL